jgi:hypothetical protein
VVLGAGALLALLTPGRGRAELHDQGACAGCEAPARA